MKVLISTQCYQSMDFRFVNQMIHTLASPPEGISLGFNFTQTSVIDVGLGIAATDFLKTDCDYLLSMDYDILFNPANDPNYKYGTEIARIVQSCEETGGLVAGPYIKRGKKDQICAVPLRPEAITIGPGGGLVEVRYVPTGFTCISRKIIQAVADRMELVDYDDTVKIFPMFMPFIYEGNGKKEYLSLDFAFCQRVKNAGFKIYLDTRLVLGHIGSTVFSAFQ